MKRSHQKTEKKHIAGPVYVIIDGYNVIYNDIQAHRGKQQIKAETARSILFEESIQWHANNRNRLDIKEIIIVYDNKKEEKIIGTQSYHRIVKVKFTSGEEADDWIIRHVISNQTKNFIVITEDHKIINAISRRHAKIMDPQQFLATARSYSKRRLRRLQNSVSCSSDSSDKNISPKDRNKINKELMDHWKIK